MHVHHLDIYVVKVVREQVDAPAVLAQCWQRWASALAIPVHGGAVGHVDVAVGGRLPAGLPELLGHRLREELLDLGVEDAPHPLLFYQGQYARTR